MGKKDIGAIKFKLIYVFIPLLMIVKVGCAQTDSFAFQKSFIRSLKYPSTLRETCTPTFTNLLFDVSNRGEISDIKLSDSAPGFFVKEFVAIKKNLEMDAIKALIKDMKLKDCNIIIPIFYVYGANYCVNTFEPIGYLNNNYLLFAGKASNKLSFLMKPIFVSMDKPIY